LNWSNPILIRIRREEGTNVLLRRELGGGKRRPLIVLYEQVGVLPEQGGEKRVSTPAQSGGGEPKADEA